MGLPNIFISFKTAGTTAIVRGQRGTVALILKDSVHLGATVLTDPTDIPTNFSTYNLEQINLAYKGGVQVPKKLIIYVQPVASTNYTEGEKYLEGTKFDYVAIPSITSADALLVATWIKNLRDNKDIKSKAVLPIVSGDHEGVINYATNSTIVGTETYTATDYCGRIAGVLAGTPLQMSATYAVLTEVTDCPHLTTDEFNAQIALGQLLLINDGSKVKIARGVNSLQTTTLTKGDSFKKIKVVDIMDQINSDIKTTANDTYIGKVPNTYDNKILLISAILGYFDGLVTDQLVEKNPIICIDVVAQTAYLKSNGVDVSVLTEQQIKEANTGDNVFIGGTIKIIDAMENIQLNISM
ncbi:phage tail sheath subtilisin-like domain-containing protein [Clostridium sp. DSM 17811]|nr:phage tail sheath subtilisin-like domain-containing protein [Clostridium sp. DSM 17811]